MPDARDTDEARLIDLLHSAAMYNDKGATWSGHAPPTIDAMQADFHRKQLALARSIGAERLGEALLAAIESGATARDDTGQYAGLAEQALRAAGPGR